MRKSKALAFRDKYSPITDLPPEDVGKAAIIQMVYARLAEAGEQLPDFFTLEERDAIVAKLTTPELWDRYATYRQLASWLVNVRAKSVIDVSLFSAHIDTIIAYFSNLVCTEKAEAELTQTGSEDALSDLDKLISVEKWQITLANKNRDMCFAMNQINKYNTLIKLVAKEIKIPELVSAFAYDVTQNCVALEAINDLVEIQRENTFSNYEDDGGAGTKRRKAIDCFPLFQTKPDEIPKERIAAARKQIKGLKAFVDALGWNNLERTLSDE
jgi:hypothetical protein